jgi:hypothetical protein
MDDGQPRTFRVKFDGEGVDDYGGPYREVFFALTEELCSLNQNRKSIDCFLPLLMPSPNWFHGVGSTERNSFLFKPTSSGTKEEHHSNLFFLGQVLGIAIRSQIYLKLPLASFTWDRLAEEEGVERSLEQRIQALTDQYHQKKGESFHSPFWRDFMFLYHQLQEEIRSFDQKTVDFCVMWVHEVTSGLDKEDLIDAWDTYYQPPPSSSSSSSSSPSPSFLFEEAYHEPYLFALKELYHIYRFYTESIHVVREGMSTIIPSCLIRSWSSPFDCQQMIKGDDTIDIDLLMSVTDYEEVDAKAPYIGYFWDVLKQFSEEEKRLFLRFVWARDSLPASKEHFRQRFKIMPSPDAHKQEEQRDDDLLLPRSQTCFFALNLPAYSSFEVMKKKLMYAMEHCQSMDADFKLSENEAEVWADFI